MDECTTEEHNESSS